MIYTRINKGSVRLQTGMKDGQRGASDLADGVGEAQAGEGLGQAQNGQQRARGCVAVRHLRLRLLLSHLRIHSRHILCTPSRAPRGALIIVRNAMERIRSDCCLALWNGKTEVEGLISGHASA